MTLEAWLSRAEARLGDAEVNSPRADARILAAHVLGVDRTFILTHPEHEFNELAGETLLQRRESREPLAYILGYKEFFGRRFRVTSSVLVPRPETEHLVEFALGLSLPSSASVLDIGTGPGPIAITIGLERPAWRILATDISPGAIEVAQLTAETLGAIVEFVVMDGLSGISNQPQFDLILSNPPYIKNGTELMPEVEQHEPKVALFGGPDGLEYYRIWSMEALKRLNVNGWLAVEIGYDQNSEVREIFREAGYQNIQTIADLAGHDRIVAGQKLGG